MLLGIDLGTTNVKALVVDENGLIASEESSPVSVTHLPGGGAEQDIEEIWRSTCRAVRAAVARAAVSLPGHPLRAIGVSSQGGAMQLLDASDRPAGPVIGWQDSRGAAWNASITERLGRQWFIQRTGFARGAGAIGQLLRLRQEGAFVDGAGLGFVGDVIVGRLCGRRCHDATSLSEPCLLDPARGDADDELLELLGLDRARMPALLAANEPAGGLLPGIAGSLGLAPGIPVGPAVHDQYAAAVGSGVARPGDTMFGAGTAWVLLAVSDRLSPPVADIALAGRHPSPGLFGQMLSMVNGGSCLSWLATTLGLGELSVGQIDELARAAPPGSGGARFRPLLARVAGHGLPPDAMGRIDGLRLDHGQAHLMRAAVEGLACELARHLRMMEDGGVRVSRLVMCGKAAVSGVTPQIVADTTSLPVDRVTLPETSALGAAILARWLLEPAKDLSALADGMRPALQRVRPGPDAPAAAERREEYIASLRPGTSA